MNFIPMSRNINSTIQEGGTLSPCSVIHNLADHREAGVTVGSKYGFDVSLGGTQF